MSDLFAGIVQEALTVIGPEDFNMALGQVVRGGVELGVSGNLIQQTLSQYGVGVQRQRLQSLIRTETAKLSLGAIGPPVDLSTLPPNESIRSLPEGRAGTFRTQVRVTFSQRIGPAAYQTEETVFSVASRELITPQEAIDVAANIWSQHAELYGDRELFGLEYVGTISNTGGAE